MGRGRKYDQARAEALESDDDEDDAHEENKNDRHDQRGIDDRAKTLYDVSSESSIP